MNDQILDSGWFAVKASELRVSVEELSATSDAAAGAIPAIVPGTILTTLVSNGTYLDPYYRDNNNPSIKPAWMADQRQLQEHPSQLRCA